MLDACLTAQDNFKAFLNYYHIKCCGELLIVDLHPNNYNTPKKYHENLVI